MRAHAFTLMELMVVVVMISLLAAVVSPGLGAIRGTQQAAGTVEVRRLLRTAQQLARASGRPHGLWLDCDAEHVRPVRLDEEGAVVPDLDTLGSDAPTRSLPKEFGGLRLQAVDPGNGVDVAEAVIWFDYLGRPETRDADGTNAQPATQPPTITFVDEGAIEIDRVTGVMP